jgi:ABC-type dipeptide/oligopeptide/nickel transport system permease component
VGLSFISFLVVDLDPGRRIVALSSPQGGFSQAFIDRFISSYYEQPWFIRYLNWVASVIQSPSKWETGSQISIHNLLVARLPASIELIIVSIIFALFIGIFLGIYYSVLENYLKRNVSHFFLQLGYSVPIFCLALLFQAILIFLANHSQFFASIPLFDRYSYEIFSSDYSSIQTTGFLLVDTLLALKFDFFLDVLAHIILPSFSLSLFIVLTIKQTTRRAIIETLNKEKILSIRSKTFSERIKIYKIAFKESNISMYNFSSFILASLLGGLILIEQIYNWPGIGIFVFIHDIELTRAFFLLISFIFIFCNFVSDCIYTYIQPKSHLF